MSLDIYIDGAVCPCCARSDRVWQGNVTHNLTKMAEAAGCYKAVWRPEECGIKTAEQMIEPLIKAIKVLTANPTKFRKYDPENRWGSYEGFVSFLTDYLNACVANPRASIRAWR